MLYQTRLNQIEDKNIYRFQQLIAIVCILAIIITVAINFFIFIMLKYSKIEMLINIVTIIPIIVPYAFTYFKDNKIARYLQIILTFIIGVLSIILGSLTQYFGDIVIILSVLLSIKYKVIKPTQFKIRYIIILCLLIMIIRGVIQAKTPGDISVNILITLFSGILIGFSLLIIQDDVHLNNKIKNDNQTLIRYGFNFGALLHGMNYIELLDTLNAVTEINSNPTVTRKLDLIREELARHNTLKLLFLENFKKNYEFTTQNEDILVIIDSILTEEEKLHSKVTIEKESALTKVIIKIIPFEFQCLIRNLLTNAIESIITAKTEIKRIIIKIYADENNIFIQVDDSGKGLGRNSVNINEVKSTKKQGGFGLKYITETITNYNWSVTFKESELLPGASITIIIPKEGVVQWQ